MLGANIPGALTASCTVFFMYQPSHKGFALLHLNPRSQQLRELCINITLLFREETDSVRHLPSPLVGCEGDFHAWQ